MELTAREKVALHYVRKKLADSKQPTDEQLAHRMNCSVASVRSIIARLKIKEVIRTYWVAGQRHFDLIDTSPIEPVRVERHVCPNCQAINCANPRHGYRLTSAARVPAYMGA